MEFDLETCSCTCPKGMRECRDRCVGSDQCCPTDPSCPEDPKGCCNTWADQAVCNGKCTSLDTNKNCGACGNSCGSCKTCKRNDQGNFACVAPDRNPPACETCANGEVASGTSCDNHCCPQARCAAAVAAANLTSADPPLTGDHAA